MLPVILILGYDLNRGADGLLVNTDVKLSSFDCSAILYERSITSLLHLLLVHIYIY